MKKTLSKIISRNNGGNFNLSCGNAGFRGIR